MRIVRTRRALAVAAALLLLAGCSDPQGTQPGDAVASADPGDAGSGDGGDKAGSGKDGGKPGGSGKARGGNGGGGSNGDSGGGNGGAGPDASGTGGEGGSNGSGAPYPAAGEYVYSQNGFEKFCQGPSCEKNDLPETQTINATYEARSAGTATIVTEAHPSERQTMTTTTRYSPDKAVITKVVVNFAYGSFTFSQTYEPQPPVEALRFPLQAGKKWSGRWDARTSGDYRMKVVSVDDFTFDGRPAKVYRIDTVTNFKGDFSGRAQTTIWIDARTRAIVQTEGKIAVASSFGEYTSDFQTLIQSGPGY